MFINNWYVAVVANELGEKPQRVSLLAHKFVLFRDDTGSIHCLSDACCHRGASLAQGECVRGGIMCPQHGWEYNGAGKCTMQEKYGLVFVFLGDMSEEERPAIPDIMPEWDSGEWHKDVITRHKDVNYIRMAENYNDPCHVHYIHEFAKWLPKGVTLVDQEQTDRYVKSFHAAWDAQGQHS